jgi:hypothetical protein
MNNELEYGFDPLGRARHFGIYKGYVLDTRDPLKQFRLKVRIPILSGVEVTEWAEACLPVHSNLEQPDHQPHSATLTSSSAGDVAHTHTVSVSFSHPHVTTYKNKDTTRDGPDEHVYLRKTPEKLQIVWVMFVGGDPEHPVWIGVGYDKSYQLPI